MPYQGVVQEKSDLQVQPHWKWVFAHISINAVFLKELVDLELGVEALFFFIESLRSI